MKLVVVSDLHIHSAEDPLYGSLLRLIEGVSAGDRLVLAGDIFDLFVGNKPLFRDRYSGFFEAVSSATARGAVLDYIEGNHDFLIRRAFRNTGATVHAREVVIELGGKRFLVAHGDLVDRSDYGYLALRAFFRSPLLRAFVWLAPGSWIDWIGQTSSRKSRGRKPLLVSDLPRERIESLRLTYRNHAVERVRAGFDFFVCGHCHDLDEKTFQVGDRRGQYVNVGFPRVHGTYLEWRPEDAAIRRVSMPGLPTLASPRPLRG